MSEKRDTIEPTLTEAADEAAVRLADTSQSEAEQAPAVETEAPTLTAEADSESATTAAAVGPEPDQNAGLMKIAQYHFAAAMAALTLYGAGDIWAASTGLALAQFVSVANALIAGVVLAYLSHEWGHFTGARLSGAISPVLKEPRSFFMFNFDMKQNDTPQFLSMSMGGPGANWLLVILMVALLPLATAGQAMLVATVAGVAISVSLFEIPIIRRVRAGGEPLAELQDQLGRGVLTTSRNLGILSGAVLWILLVA